MEIAKLENLSFTYPGGASKALENINISINQGEFITVMGKSGCGKTTLLRLLKPAISPFGQIEGSIFYKGKPISDMDLRQSSEEIGFVLQSPDRQTVTDKVWHELAFGLESLGFSTPEIRVRVSEMASFFGIQGWFDKKTSELSGGQKQLMNLASIMVMQPDLLILDEPTSQLDPIASSEFLKAVERINRELGVTVILSEHRLEEAFPISDRIIVMDKGKIICDAPPKKTGEILIKKGHDMCKALPSCMRIFGEIEREGEYPLTIREGRSWLNNYKENHTIGSISEIEQETFYKEDAVILKDVWFRYEKNMPDVVRGVSVQIKKGEIFSIVGGNGTGKTTLLSLISSVKAPQRGSIIKSEESLAVTLPQNPQTLFLKNSVYLDLLDVLEESDISKEEKDKYIKNTAALLKIDDLLDRHPYDLSGGEQQRVALAKVLLLSCDILLLDEPTKGLDAHFKEIFADVLLKLKQKGVTVIMVSHDIEFCALYSDRCALMFNGNFTSVDTPRSFFAGKSFYTTAANKMARDVIPGAVTSEDVIVACGGKIKEKAPSMETDYIFPKRVKKEEKKWRKIKKHPRLGL